MRVDYRDMDSAALRGLYEQKLQELSKALLEGASWEQVQDQRFLLVELSRQLSKAGAPHTPAEQPARRNDHPTAP